MRCGEVERILLDGREAALSAEEGGALARHLEGCRSCRRLRADMSVVQSEAAALRMAEAERGIAGRVAQAAGVNPYRAPFPTRRLLWPALGMTAATLAFLVIGKLGHRPDRPTPLVVHNDVRRSPKTQRDPVAPPITNQIVHSNRPTDGPDPVSNGDRRRLVTAGGPRHDDLDELNAADTASVGRWVYRPTGRAAATYSVRKGDEFVHVPLPQVASKEPRALADAYAKYRQEREIVDERLALKKVSLQIKGASFSELCKRLTASTSIKLTAGRSVEEDKVTVFCAEKPLRDVMRQINQNFGYQWARSGKKDDYAYELFQDLKSQLAEEAMRNRDRDEALLDLDRKMQEMRKYLDLSPEEAHKKAWAEERTGYSQEELNAYNLLEGPGWGGAHLYHDLSRDQLGRLREGETLRFSSGGGPGTERLPTEIGNGVVGSLHDQRVVKMVDGRRLATRVRGNVGQPISDFPDARKDVELRMDFGTLGQVSLWGGAGIGFDGEPAPMASHPLAVGMSPGTREPKNAEVNAALAREPALQGRIHLLPKPSVWGEGELVSLPEPAPGDQPVTIADVLEAVHKATGMDVMSDHFTRVYPADYVSVRNTSLFDALNKACDKMRVRWGRKEGWLRFRSTSFFVDRVTEIPNPLLARWAAMRKKAGWMTPEIMMEVAQLPDVKLDYSHMAGGPAALFGLREWYAAGSVYMRPHWRFLAALTPEMRQAALSEKGLDVSRFTVAQQGRYFSLGLAAENERMRPRKKPDSEWVVRIQRNNEIGHLSGPLTKATMPETDITYRFRDPEFGPWAVQIRVFEH